MKRYSGFIKVAVAALFLSGCIGSGGSSAPAPTDAQAFARDSRVIVTWTMEPGVEYWVYHAYGSGVTPQNCTSMYSCGTAVNVTSPASISGLSNGMPLPYSFSINGRRNGGPGGPGSVAVTATPRLAGDTWSTGTSTGTNLRGVAYGVADTKFVAAGDSGALYSGAVFAHNDGTTGITWSPLVNPLSAYTFNAVGYDATHSKYLAVGDGGKIITMAPATSSNWSPQNSTVTSALFAVASSGAVTVATGAAGTIIYSADGGLTWADKTASVSGGNPGTALNGVAFGQSMVVAVGAARTLLYSTDGGLTWAQGTCGASCTGTPDLKGVTYGSTGSTGLFIAVGASGTVLTSPDGMTWTQQTAISTATLNAVTYSAAHRFVAVAADGSIYFNEYTNAGVTWNSPVAATGTALNAVTTGGLFDYSAVGAGGVNKYAD